jgi:hypothetical protein
VGSDHHPQLHKQKRLTFYKRRAAKAENMTMRPAARVEASLEFSAKVAPAPRVGSNVMEAAPAGKLTLVAGKAIKQS